MMKTISVYVAVVIMSAASVHAEQAAPVSRSVTAKPAAVQPAAATQKWQAFDAKGIQTIRLTHVAKDNLLKVYMSGIKATLEKADIDEKVSVFLYDGSQQIAHLGTYTPTKRSGGGVLFKQMPSIKNIQLSENQKAPQHENVVLVFKNADGAIVAELTSKVLQNKAIIKDNTSIPR